MCKVQLNWRWSKKRALCSAPLSTGRVRGKGAPQRSIPLIWLPLPGSLSHLNSLSPSAWLLLLGTHILLGFRPIYSLVELRARVLSEPYRCDIATVRGVSAVRVWGGFTSRYTVCQCVSWC
jgi:hypothetical protein